MRTLFRAAAGAAVTWGAVRLASSTLRDVTGGSMRPLLDEGHRLLVLPPSPAGLRPGAVVVVRDPRQPKRETVKRLVAVGPASVQLDRDGLRIDGVAMAEPYTSTLTLGDHAWEVPDGHLLVLGDNRLASTDARTYGPVDPGQVTGVVALCLRPFRADLFGAPVPQVRSAVC